MTAAAHGAPRAVCKAEVARAATKQRRVRRALARWRREQPARRRASKQEDGALPRAAALVRWFEQRIVQRLQRWCLLAAPNLVLRWCEPKPHLLGAVGERLAAIELRRAGLRLIERNVLRNECEVDLLLEDGGVLVVAEVKTSRCSKDEALGERRYRPADRVDHRRRERLARAAAGLGRATGRAARVDVVEVWIKGSRRRVEYAWHREVLPRA